MTRIAIPALLYLEVKADHDDAAISAGEKLRYLLDTEDGCELTLPDGHEATLRVNFEGYIEIVEPYQIPEGGGAAYEVVVRMTVDGCEPGEAPEDWPEDDALPGDYDFRVIARNIFEAAEAAKDEFHNTQGVSVLDEVTVEVVSVRQVEPIAV